MDLGKALAELRDQRDAIDQAILSLERLASGRPRGRGRPPGSKNTHPVKRPGASSHASAERVKTATE
jgi:hypothetical protein